MHSNRILILDDEPLTGQTIQSIAEFAGMQARHTADAGEFFRLVQDWRPSHIALDLIMPDMDGVQIMIELARLRCRARLIVTSGAGTRVLDAAARSASEHGLLIAGVLAKPFSPPRLRELLIAPDTADDSSVPAARGSVAASDIGESAIDSRADLERALAEDQLFIVYQPKISCTTGMVHGFEALVRWQHPELGIVSPDRFIPLAEQCGLVDRLTAQVLEKSIIWLNGLPSRLRSLCSNHYLSSRAESFTLSVNISATSLVNQALFDQLDAICAKHGFQRNRLIFELTETSAMEDPVASLDMLTRLRMKGFHLSIDDFGTGYSSMLQLARLPFSEIKVDKSFVMTAAGSAESRTVVRSIIELGRGLGLRTTAEGIEDEEALTYLKEAGCDLAQGYHIARPMTGEDAAGWLLSLGQNNEESRLRMLHAMNLLDTADEERFDRITRLAARLFGVPTSLLSLVDAERQWFKSAYGLDVRETPREISFCTHAIEQEETLIIHDARSNTRFADNPLVTGFPYIRFYAGSALHAANGSKLGTLCLIDSHPRVLTPKEETLLKDLGKVMESELKAGRPSIEEPLTGLLDRQAFEQRAGELLSLCQRHRIDATILYFDIDNFRDYTGKQGAEAGDAQLGAFSRQLRDVYRDADLICRFGEDEFVVLLIAWPPADIAQRQQKLAERFAGLSLAGGATPDFSVGQARLQLDGNDDLQQLLARADRNMLSNREDSRQGQK